MLEVGFRCECINDCWDFDMKRGMIYGGTVTIDEYGDTTFAIDLPGGGPLKCVQEWFANYFKIIK